MNDHEMPEGGKGEKEKESRGEKEKGKVLDSIKIPACSEPPTSMTLAQSRVVHLMVEGRPIECDLDRLLDRCSMIREMFDICRSPTSPNKPEKSDIEEIPITGPVSYDTMHWVVRYIHCLADVHITKEDNYKQLMEAADFLGIESLSNQCRRFVVDRLKLNNCVDRWSFLCTKLGLDQLRQHTEDYMSAVFYDLMDSPHSRDVTEELLMSLLQRDDLRVKSEGILFDLLVSWAEQPERILDSSAVFELVQYHLLSERELKDAICRLSSLEANIGHDLSSIKENLIFPAVEYNRLRYEDKLSYWSGRTKPSRWPKIIVTRLDKVNENIGTMEAGHRDHRDGLFSLKGYDFSTDTWFVLEKQVDGGQLNHLQKYTGCCSTASHVYWVGGVKTPQQGQTEASLKYVHSYDVERGEMFTEPALLEGRKSPAVVAHAGKIYIFGGRKVEYRQHQQLGPPELGHPGQQGAAAAGAHHVHFGHGIAGLMIHFGRAGPAAVAGQDVPAGLIMAHGHHLPRLVEQPETQLVSAEVYTPGEGSRPLPNLPEEFNNGLGIATHQDEIYLQFSNGSNSENPNPVYTFNTETEIYTESAPLPEKRYKPAMESMNNKLYLFGGLSESEIMVDVSLNYQAMVKENYSSNWADANIFDDHYRSGCRTVHYQGTFYCLGGRMKKYSSLQTAGAICTPNKSNLWREWPIPDGLLPSKCEASPGDYPYIHMVLVDKPVRFMHTDLPDKLHCDKVVEIVNIIEYDSDAEENGDDDIGDGVGAGASRDSDPTPGPSSDGKQMCDSDTSGAEKEEDESSLASTSRDDILDLLVSMSPCPWSPRFPD